MDNLIEFLQESRPSRSVLSSVTIIGPYPSKNFIEKILDQYKPLSIDLIVDYSAKYATDDIKSVIDNNVLNIRFVRSSHVGGLVHSKVYLLKWKINKTKKYKSVLFVGSANASNNGFLKNSETLQSIPVSSIEEAHRKKLRDYFRSLSSGNGSKQLILNLLSGSKLWLPEIIQANDNMSDFSGWIRNGVICHKFDPDGTFGKLNIHLKSPLPKTVHEATLSKRGFSRKTKKEILSRRYIEIGNGNAKATWKGKYFTETWLGDWVSYECFRDSKNNKLTNKDGEIIRFLSSDSESREVAIKKILNANTRLTNTWKAECLLELNNAYKELVKRKKKPSRYFEMRGHKIDDSYYLEGLKNKIERDRNKAGISSFKNRFVAGYDFNPIPSLGESENDFIVGLCDSILNAGHGSRVTNKLASTIIRCLGDKFYSVNDGEELYQLIEEQWSGINIDVMSYHENT